MLIWKIGGKPKIRAMTTRNSTSAQLKGQRLKRKLTIAMVAMNVISIVMITILLNGCYIPDKQPKVKVYTQEESLVVIGKKVVHSNARLFSSAYDEHFIAFDNGEYLELNYGEYEIVNVGDTMKRSKLNTEWSWNYTID